MLVILYAWTLASGFGASLLGSLWPVMYLDFDVALSSIGIFSWISSGAGFVSNLAAGWALRKFGASKTTAIASFLVALTTLGFTLSGEYWMLCLLVIPNSFAGGIVGVAMNNYIAQHYRSYHMNWIHCMWGVGSIIGPNVIAYTLSRGYTWHLSYRVMFVAWVLHAVSIFVMRKWWKPDPVDTQVRENRKAVPLRGLLKIRGVKEALLTFFCYTSLEQGMMLWMSSYMILSKGISEEQAARYASFFFMGITAGRMLSGFLTMRIQDSTLIRIGQGVVAVGGILMLISAGNASALAALLLIGCGCAPIYPSLLQLTPRHFGKENSQAMIGAQIAAATVGNCALPSLFGVVATKLSMALLPVYVLLCLAGMVFASGRLEKVTVAEHAK